MAPYRALPSADALLRAPGITDLTGRYQRHAVVTVVREVLDDFRSGIAGGGPAPSFEEVVAAVKDRVARRWRTGPSPVINATGVILHTNLGRAPLSEEALEAVRAVAAYSDLEFDLASGRRGSRQQHTEALLHDLTGAEAAYVTVNAASALLLSLATHCRGREVVVSRGQALEIGGGFRIPTILRQSGARLVEVGTTNRTRLEDYQEAMTPRTAAILHVHASNFRIEGFTEGTPLHRLAELSSRRGSLLIADNGSGALIDTAQFGLAHEPTPLDALSAGADLVIFSGDKLLGGPQAGIALGRNELITRMSRHPLARAMRPDKTSVAALSATLMSYLRGDATEVLPIWQMIGASVESIRNRSHEVIARLGEAGIRAELRDGQSTVGGGSLPTEILPTVLIAVPRQISASGLRAVEPAVIARTVGGSVLLDLRTVLPEQDRILVQALLQARERGGRASRSVIDSSAR